MGTIIHWEEIAYQKIFSRCRRVLLWGAGSRGFSIMGKIASKGFSDRVVGFIDSNPRKVGGEFAGKPVFSRDRISTLQADGIIIASYYEKEIIGILREMRFPGHRIFRSMEWELIEEKDAEIPLWRPDFRWKQTDTPSVPADNFLRFLAGLGEADTAVQTVPFFLHIEPTQQCNLSCPVCPQLGRPEKGAAMKLLEFQQIIDDFGPSLYYLHLYRKGESFTNRDFFGMLKYARERSSALIYLSSNFSFRLSASELKELLASADYIGLCMDGMSSETYNYYRRGGNFDIVRGNLEHLAALYQELRPNCTLVWRFIVFRHNEHEVQAAIEFAKRYRVNIEFVQPFVPDSSWLPRKKEYWRNIYKYPKRYSNKAVPRPKDEPGCIWLYGSTGIGADGVLYPCCEFEAGWGNFGSFLPGRVADSFNTKEYRIARGGTIDAATTPGGHCRQCPSSIRQTTGDFVCHCRNIQGFLVRNPYLCDRELLGAIDTEKLSEKYPDVLTTDFVNMISEAGKIV